MWKAEYSSTINGPIEKAWEVLITPELWQEADPTHYKTVEYSLPSLKEGVKGKMAAESSQKFSFKPVAVDDDKHKLVTESPIPMGKLRLTKRLTKQGSIVKFDEEVMAKGPFAKLFSRLFFEKQIKATLPAQHEAIKKYVEG